MYRAEISNLDNLGWVMEWREKKERKEGRKEGRKERKECAVENRFYKRRAFMKASQA